jgi:hypothetical protein
MALVAFGRAVFEKPGTHRPNFQLLPDPDRCGTLPCGDYPNQSAVDSGAIQRAGRQRDLPDRRPDPPDLSKVSLLGEYAIQRVVVNGDEGDIYLHEGRGGRGPARSTAGATLFEHLAEDVLQDAAMLVIRDFFGSIHAGQRRDCFYFAVWSLGFDCDLFSRGQGSDAFDIEYLMTG